MGSFSRVVVVVALAFASLAAAGGDEPTTSERLGSSPSLDQLKLGFTAMAEGRYEAALDHYQLALERASTSELSFQANIGIGSAAAALGRLDEARAAFRSALAIKPESAETLFSLGQVATKQERWDEAAGLFAEAAVTDPEFVDALIQLGVVYEHQGRHDEAADVCRRAVAVRPEDEEALLCLGVARYHMGLYAEASKSFAAVVERDPTNARARYGLGLVKLFLEDRDPEKFVMWIAEVNEEYTKRIEKVFSYEKVK